VSTQHFNPSRRQTKRTVSVSLYANPSPPRAPASTSARDDERGWDLEPKELLVPRRYYGRVVAASGKAPLEPASVVVVKGTFPCGSAPVHSDGTFVLDLAATDACACPNSRPGHSPITLTFQVGGRAAFSTTTHLHLDQPTTLGRAEAITLAAPWLR
jgi:hypothetical protein